MKDILDKKIEKVVVSNRLVTSPGCIVTSQVIPTDDERVATFVMRNVHILRSVWVDSKHGANHEGTGAEGHLDPGCQETSGDQPRPQHWYDVSVLFFPTSIY